MTDTPRTQFPATIAGVRIPDSSLARDARDYVREVASDLLFDHSMRVFLFGALQGRRKSLSVDLELLYVGALFHDVGLVEGHRSQGDRFEVDGANEAADFLRDRGVDEWDVWKVWDGIALHTTPGIPQHKAPEVALVTAGVELDVLGIGYDDIDLADRDAIVALFPRPQFKERIVQAFADGILHKPQTAFGNVKADVLQRKLPGYSRPDFCRMIDSSPWPE